MFNLPNILVMPLIGGAVGATLEWPAVGAVLAWLLILSLLSASAGLMRDREGRPSEPPLERRSASPEPETALPHIHREAA